MLDKEELLSHIQEDETEIMLAKVLDKVEKALQRHEPQVTNFLNPRQFYLAEEVLNNISNLKFYKYGGYKKAERNRLVFVPDYYMEDLIESPIVLLDIKGQFKFQRVEHGDFLGAILGTGIKREMVGDLILYEQGCQAIIADEIKDFLLLNLEQVHQIGVELSEISFARLKKEPERIKEIRDTVASLRLDSVASSGFSTSRTRMSKIIEAGKVKVNWKVVKDPSYFLDEQDLISIRGWGRVEIDEFLGKSRKGRLKIKLKRYL